MPDMMIDTVTNLGGRGIVAALDASNQLLLLFLNSLEKTNFEKNAAILKEYLKNTNGSLLFYMPQDFALEDIEKKLNENDIKYVEQLDTNTQRTIIAVRDCDRDIVHRLQMEIYAEQKRITRLTPSDFYRLNVNKTTYSLNDIDRYQLKILQSIARKNDFVFTAIPKDNEHYQVFFANKDAIAPDGQESKMKQALILLALRTAGIDGAFKKRVYDSDISVIDEANNKIHSPTRDFYVCSADSKRNYKEYVHVDINSFAHCNGDSTIVFEQEKDNNTFEEDFSNIIYGMKNPVILTKEEFSLPEEEKQKIIKEKYQRRSATYTEFEANAAKSEIKARQIILDAIESNQSVSMELFADYDKKELDIITDFTKEFTNNENKLFNNISEITDISQTELADYLNIEDSINPFDGSDEMPTHSGNTPER